MICLCVVVTVGEQVLLAHIYEKLGDASLAETKQLGIFITLLQVNVKS